ncbi:MAG: YhdP family protein [Pseudomonadota bacterium]
MSRSLLWLLNKIWLVLAIVLVLAAVLMSALRYALPHIPDVSRQLAVQIEERLQQPVSIDQLAISWHRQGPAVDVTGISLQPDPASPIQVDVDTISVVLDFWQSLLQQQVVAQEFILDNAHIDVDLRQLKRQQESISLELLENLFLQQLERFSLTESELNVVNLAGNRRSVVIERLSWFNQGSHHQGVGKFRVRDFTRNSLDFIIQLDGNDLASVNGQFYVDSRQVDISPWLEQQLGQVDITESSVNFTSWLSLRDGDISAGHLQLRDNRIQANVEGQLANLHIPSGEIAIQPQSDGWLLNVQPMTIELDNRRFELPLIAWQSNSEQNLISSQSVPLHDLLPFVEWLAPSSADLVAQHERAETRAHADIRLDFSKQRRRWLIMSNDLQSTGSGAMPSWSPLQVALLGEDGRGWWRMHSDQVTLSNAALSSQQAWQLGELDLNGGWQRDDTGWMLYLKPSGLQFDDLSLNLSGRLRGGHQQVPQIALHARSEDPFAVATARKFLPQVMGSKVKKSLSDALQKGSVEGLQVLWRGPLNQFPDDSMQGVFNARVDFASLDYQFHRDWPAAKNLPLRLDFYQTGLNIFADDGTLMGVNINEINARIPQLTDPAKGIQLSSRISADAGQLQPVFAASPLTGIAKTLDQVRLQQPVSGEFNLDIAFDRSRKVAVSVNADLAGQQIYLPAIDQTFAVSEGELQVNNDKVSSRDLQLSWQQQPIKADVSGQSVEGDYLLTVDTDIDWQLEPLFEAMPVTGWDKYLRGALKGQGQLTLELSDKVATRWQSQFDLSRVVSDLPAPLSKSAGEKGRLDLNIEGTGEQFNMQLAMADILRWKSQWRSSQQGWQQAALTIGQAQLPAGIKNNDFLINASLPQLNVAEWYDLLYFMRQGLSKDSGDSEPVNKAYLPDYIRVVSDSMLWAGQQFNDVELSLWPEQQGWEGNARAEGLALVTTIPNQFTEQPITVDADYIELSSQLASDSSTPLRQSEQQWQWITRLPPLKFSCKTCKLDDKRFTDVLARLQPIEGGVQLTELQASSENSELSAAGSWLVGQGQPTTQINGSLQSEDFGDLLRAYGLETAIRDSEANIDFGLQWNDHPHRFAVDSLAGGLQWSLGRGYLAEVSDGGARLFSLLSLDGILRKLTLDFRDIFSQGMFYTDLSGSAQIVDGVVKTTDTQLQGSAGNMDITGTTNLVSESLDYQLTYAPKVTSSLPVILAWMINPPSGLAALLIDKVLQDAEVISQLRYQVNGTISEPQVTEVERDSRPVEIPDVEIGEEKNNNDSAINGNSAQQSADATTKPAAG